MNQLDPDRRDALIRNLQTVPRPPYHEIVKKLRVATNTVVNWMRRLRLDRCTCGRPIHTGPCRHGQIVVTESLRRQIVAERVNARLTIDELVVKFGASRHAVQRAVTGHPIHDRRWSVRAWTPEEMVVLGELWPSATTEDIRLALPGRGWSAIQSRAQAIGVSRRRGSFPVARTLHPLVACLVRERERLGMSRSQIAERGSIPLTSLERYELGMISPPLERVIAWAAALGCEVMLSSDVERRVEEAHQRGLRDGRAESQRSRPAGVGYSMFDGHRPIVRPLARGRPVELVSGHGARASSLEN